MFHVKHSFAAKGGEAAKLIVGEKTPRSSFPSSGAFMIRGRCRVWCGSSAAHRAARIERLASRGSGVSPRADQAPRAVRRSLRASCLRMFHVKHSFVRNRACRTCGSARGPAFPRLRLSVHNARLASACVNRRPRTPACAPRALCAPRPARAYRASLPMASMSYGVVWYT